MSARGNFERYALILHHPWKWNSEARRPDFLQLSSKSECVSEFDEYINQLQIASCTPTPTSPAESTPSDISSPDSSPTSSLPDSSRSNSVTPLPSNASALSVHSGMDVPDASSDTESSASDSHSTRISLEMKYTLATRARNRLAWITTLASGIAPDDNDKRMCTHYRNREVDHWDSIIDPESFFTANQPRAAEKIRPNNTERLKAEKAINRLNAEARQDEGIPLKKLEVMVHAETSATHVRHLLNRTTVHTPQVTALKGSFTTNFTAAEIKGKYKLLEDDTSLQVTIPAVSSETILPLQSEIDVIVYPTGAPNEISEKNLNKHQANIFNIMKKCVDAKSRRTPVKEKAPNIFIHGGPGAGKSTLINTITEYAKEHQLHTIKVAPMASAANLIGGSTIHRVTGLKFEFTIADIEMDLIGEKLEKLECITVYESAWGLIIDEISAVSSMLLYGLDIKFRKIFKRDLPFGGLPVFLLGDFFQLPPPMGTSLFNAVINELVQPMIDNEANSVKFLLYFKLKHKAPS